MNEIGEEPVVAYGSYDEMGGYEAMASLQEFPEAMICVSDLIALGAVRFLNEHPQFKIPVIGSDGGFLTDLIFPRLTSIKQPFFEAGQRLADALVNFIEGADPIQEVVTPELVVKESTWPKEVSVAGTV